MTIAWWMVNNVTENSIRILFIIYNVLNPSPSRCRLTTRTWMECTPRSSASVPRSSVSPSEMRLAAAPFHGEFSRNDEIPFENSTERGRHSIRRLANGGGLIIKKTW